MSHVLITRPQHEAQRTAAAFAYAGYHTSEVPLTTIQMRSSGCEQLATLPLMHYGAILTTSQHGVAALAAVRKERHIPLYVVGEGSASIAGKAGFQHIITAHGGAEALLSLLDQQAVSHLSDPVLYLRAVDVRMDMAEALAQRGIVCQEIAVYEACLAVDVADAFIAALPHANYVTFHALRPLLYAQDLMRQHGVDATHATALCLSPAIARGAEASLWRDVMAAPVASDDGLVYSLPNLAV